MELEDDDEPIDAAAGPSKKCKVIATVHFTVNMCVIGNVSLETVMNFFSGASDVLPA